MQPIILNKLNKDLRYIPTEYKQILLFYTHKVKIEDVIDGVIPYNSMLWACYDEFISFISVGLEGWIPVPIYIPLYDIVLINDRCEKVKTQYKATKEGLYTFLKNNFVEENFQGKVDVNSKVATSKHFREEGLDHIFNRLK